MQARLCLSGLLLIGLTLTIQGCGFHLRGTQSTAFSLPQSISPLYLSGLGAGSYLKIQLENRLVDAGIQLTDAPPEAAATLHVNGPKSNRRVLAVDSRGKVIEYLLTEKLTFSLSAKNGGNQVAPQSIDLSQSYINPEEKVLGAQEEERSLREDMWRSMADQIIRRLAAQLR
ncbi:MAG: hypothetical protein KDI63_00220 [Gammaproteobacteria bacterium]|nr:hypothetical protein [Gammaproteobacteria bacterium]